jgi:hypothetical protein
LEHREEEQERESATARSDLFEFLHGIEQFELLPDPRQTLSEQLVVDVVGQRVFAPLRRLPERRRGTVSA